MSKTLISVINDNLHSQRDILTLWGKNVRSYFIFHLFGLASLCYTNISIYDQIVKSK